MHTFLYSLRQELEVKWMLLCVNPERRSEKTVCFYHRSLASKKSRSSRHKYFHIFIKTNDPSPDSTKR